MQQNSGGICKAIVFALETFFGDVPIAVAIIIKVLLQ